MINFIMILLVASFMGLQIGLFTVLRIKNVSLLRSLLYSFGMYLLPVLVITVHIQLYKDRHKLIEKMGANMSPDELFNLGEKLNGVKFLWLSTVEAIKDLLDLNDNLTFFVEVVEAHNRKMTRNRMQTLSKRDGFFGIAVKGVKAIRGELRNHTFADVTSLREKLS